MGMELLSAGEPQAKTVNNKDYIYCPHHSDTKWVLKVNSEGTDQLDVTRPMQLLPKEMEMASMSALPQ